MVVEDGVIISMDFYENAQLLKLHDTIVLPCSYPLHEAESAGLLVDRDRMIGMVDKYEAKKVELLKKLAQPAFAGNKSGGPTKRTKFHETVARGKLAFESDELIIGTELFGQR